ncbi:hypothetical protein [Nocardia asiatica]|uniref:hypothetical protein n=1 Tax=Nocardia asiatica TaxID=209252 RepID=UPI002458AA7E|nr:hypothetical protein [Nocardia asiatica]
MTSHRTRALTVTAALTLTVGLASTACSTPERWCELDRGDVVVDNSYCAQGMPGYEWEPDHDKPKHKKAPKNAKKGRH